MQISCGVYPEISQEKYLRVDQKRTGTDHSGTRAAEGKHGGGGASDGGSRSYAVVDTTEVLGFRGGGVYKGKSAIAIARNYMDRAKNFVGQNFWARGYYVSTVGRDEAQIREYIRAQEKEDQRLDQLNMFK